MDKLKYIHKIDYYASEPCAMHQEASYILIGNYSLIKCKNKWKSNVYCVLAFVINGRARTHVLIAL